MKPTIVELDVRPMLANGEEPFERIMAAVDELDPQQSLCLIAPLHPVPLIRLLAQRGYEHTARRLSAGDWEVMFRPPDHRGIEPA